MLPVDSSTVRLYFHIVAATIWVGGQIALLAVVPVVRRSGGVEATRSAARRFQLVAWPAFAVLVVTGIWNLAAADVADQSSEYLTTLFVKLLLVGLSGAGAIAHTLFVRRNPAIGGIAAGVGLLAALGAVFFGVVLTVG